MKDNWISVKEELPKLPDVSFYRVIVAACNEGDTKSRPMLYQRSTIRGQAVEKWLTASGEETYRTPDYWQPMPTPPKWKKAKEGSEPIGERC